MRPGVGSLARWRLQILVSDVKLLSLCQALSIYLLMDCFDTIRGQYTFHVQAKDAWSFHLTIDCSISHDLFHHLFILLFVDLDLGGVVTGHRSCCHRLEDHWRGSFRLRRRHRRHRQCHRRGRRSHHP